MGQQNKKVEDGFRDLGWVRQGGLSLGGEVEVHVSAWSSAGTRGKNDDHPDCTI